MLRASQTVRIFRRLFKKDGKKYGKMRIHLEKCILGVNFDLWKKIFRNMCNEDLHSSHEENDLHSQIIICNWLENETFYIATLIGSSVISGRVYFAKF